MSYLNAPLSVLAYGRSWRERLETLVMWGVFDVGTGTLKNYREKEDVDVEAKGRLEALFEDYDEELSKVKDDQWDDVFRWALGMETLGINVKWRDMAACKAAYDRLEAFSAQRQHLLKREPASRVFVSGLQTEWVLRAAKAVRESGKPTNKVVFAESHLAVLMAVLSKSGGTVDGKPRINMVTWPEIQYRAMGYLSKKEMDAHLPHRLDGAKPLSQFQIDRRARQLDAAPLKYFVRYVHKIGKKALPAYYGWLSQEAEVVKVATEAFAAKRGGWKEHSQKNQRRREAMANKANDFGWEMKEHGRRGGSAFDAQADVMRL